MEELIKGKKLERIPYANKPLAQGGKLEYLTEEELKQKFHFDYTESLFGSKETLQKYLGDEKFLTELKSRVGSPKEQAILDRLQHPLECLALCDMGPEVGYGLFATEDIPEGTVLFLYAGTIEDVKYSREIDSYYTYVWGGNSRVAEAEKVINAYKIGGLARFMQHLPQDSMRQKEFYKKIFKETEIAEEILDKIIEQQLQSVKNPELENLVFKNPEVKKTLATANVYVSQTVVNNIPVVVCTAQRDIKKNEMLGFSYGIEYWESADFIPRYFDNTGKLIPTNQYYQKKDRDKTAVAALLGKKENLNPVSLYKEGKNEYDEGNYLKAVAKFEAALEVYQQTKDEPAMLRCGQCYLALADCYTKLNNLAAGIVACENAIKIFYDRDPKKLQTTLSKYNNFLANLNADVKVLYEQAVKLHEKKNYPVALHKLFFIIGKLNKKLAKDDEKAYCHSLLASCYRELNDFDNAIAHCEQSLQIRKALYGEEHELTKNVIIKLEKLKQMQAKQKQETEVIFK